MLKAESSIRPSLRRCPIFYSTFYPAYYTWPSTRSNTPAFYPTFHTRHSKRPSTLGILPGLLTPPFYSVCYLQSSTRHSTPAILLGLLPPAFYPPFYIRHSTQAYYTCTRNGRLTGFLSGALLSPLRSSNRLSD